MKTKISGLRRLYTLRMFLRAVGNAEQNSDVNLLNIYHLSATMDLLHYTTNITSIGDLKRLL